MSVVNVLAEAQAPLGAAYQTGRPFMPLLTELNLASAGGPYYRPAAPNGAGGRVGRKDPCMVHVSTSFRGRRMKRDDVGRLIS